MNHENSVARSRIERMEGELLHYRSLFHGAGNQRNTSIKLCSSGGDLPGESEPSTSGDITSYPTATTFSYPQSTQLLLPPRLVNEDQRASAYDSSSIGSYLPAIDVPMKHLRSGGCYPRGAMMVRDGCLNSSACLLWNCSHVSTVSLYLRTKARTILQYYRPY
jgi:hypothetical protein